MMDFDGYGAGPGMWAAGGLMMLLFMGGLAALLIWGVRTWGRSRGAASGQTIKVLRGRLASGEITTAEYESIRSTLDR